MLKEHQCRLPNPPPTILCQVIDSGLFIKLRRKCHSFIMISKKHPMSSVYFTSNNAIRNEEIKHLANYFHIIHPLSMFALYWEFLIFICYTASFFILTVITSEKVQRHITLSYMFISYLDLIITADIVKMFFTGYYDGVKNRTILRQSKIAIHYLKTYFLLDFVTILLSRFSLTYVIHPTSALQKFILVLRFLYSWRIIRLKRWAEALELFRLYTNLPSVFHRALRALLLYVIMLQWLYSLIFQFGIFMDVQFDVDVRFWRDTKYSNYYSATLMILLVSYGHSVLKHTHELVGVIIGILVGYCLQMFLFTQILQVWIKFSNARNKNESLFQQFTEYLKYKDLPVSLRKKFFSFYQFKFQNQFYNEAHINRMVSKILKQEILVYVTKNHVQRVEFFKDMPDAVLAKLVSRLKSEIYLANDVILTAGVAGNCMYFIYFGTVAIYSPGGREICHLEDGAHFGEIALIFNEPRVASVKAVTPCELFILNRSDFLEVLEPHPDIKDKITLLAQERLRTTGFLQEDNG
nr:potassium/sodium hyperpolarization-activated cyclic nucleotide-gated channel 1-like isoform X2 [Leptinotarsa decemlineata]